MRTRFTELVGCDVPVQLAPMGLVCTPELMSAVADAGGMAMAGMPMAPAPVVAQFLDDIATRVHGPVGFNMLLPFLDVDVVQVAAARCRVVDFYHGPVDAKLIDLVHKAGALAAWQVGSIDEARRAHGAGVDLIIVRGVEGGGRMYGGRSTWPLLVEILDTVDVPVLAAGGIANGRLLAAALAAGADGVRIGTRLVATLESGAHPMYKDALVAAAGDETVLTSDYAVTWPDEVRGARVLERARDAAERASDPVGRMMMGPIEMEVPRFHPAPPLDSATGNVDAMAMYAGESTGAIGAVESAGDVLRRMVADAQELLQRAAAL